MTSIADIEKLGETIVNNIIDHEASINMLAGLAGLSVPVAYAEKFLPMIASTLHFMQQETGKPWTEVLSDLMSHLTPGQPNAPVLSPTNTSVDHHQDSVS